MGHLWAILQSLGGNFASCESAVGGGEIRAQCYLPQTKQTRLKLEDSSGKMKGAFLFSAN